MIEARNCPVQESRTLVSQTVSSILHAFLEKFSTFHLVWSVTSISTNRASGLGRRLLQDPTVLFIDGTA